MIVWFVSIALLGIGGIMRHPGVLRRSIPGGRSEFFLHDGLRGFLVLGAVVLVVTGAEALYADMGHFGARPIRLTWFAVVLPALTLNYFGQGALLIANPAATGNPFYALVPAWGLYPMVAVSTAAAIVASQALISGAFSLTRQAMQLGYSPRMTIQHTSDTAIGQIYLPQVNRILGVACVFLVLTFQSTTNLASAYGIAVTGTMTITSILFCRWPATSWHWPRWRVAAIGALFLGVDLSFLGANLVKITSGGWFPLLVAVVVYLLMTTWKRGRGALTQILRDDSLPIDLFLQDVARSKPARVPGIAVFMTSDPAGAPVVLLHHLKHNKVLHETRPYGVDLAEARVVPDLEDEIITALNALRGTLRLRDHHRRHRPHPRRHHRRLRRQGVRRRALRASGDPRDDAVALAGRAQRRPAADGAGARSAARW